MGEFKRGKLRSGSKTGPKVKSRKQAVAIAMSESKRKKAKNGGKGKRQRYAKGGKTPDEMRREAGAAKDLTARRILNALPTLFGMGLGVYRGADFSMGPAGSILARFPEEEGQQVNPQALGDVMLIPDRLADSPSMVTHELGHVSQGRDFGWLLPAIALGLEGGVKAGLLEENPLETEVMRRGEEEKARIGFQDGGFLSTLGDLPFYLRYGVGEDEKVRTGRELAPTKMPDEVDRTAAGYLGTKMWGPKAALAFQELRNATGLSSLLGESDEDRARLYDALVEGVTRAQEETRGEAMDRGSGKTKSPGKAALIRGAHGGRAKFEDGGGVRRRDGGRLLARTGTRTATRGAAGGYWGRRSPAGPVLGGGMVGGGGGVGLNRGYDPFASARAGATQTPVSGGGGGGGAPGGGGTFGSAQKVAGQAANFQPLTGAAAATQNQLLTTGAPTDVAPLTEAAKMRGQQEFDDLQNQIGERYAAMGLGSSTASQAAIARERARIGTNIGATGLEAGVAAQEAATGRRQGAVGHALGASGQQLQGLGTGLSGLTSLTGIAEGGRQADASLAQGADQFQANLNQNANLANQQFMLEQARLNMMQPQYYADGGRVRYAQGGPTARDALARRAYGEAFADPASYSIPQLLTLDPSQYRRGGSRPMQGGDRRGEDRSATRYSSSPQQSLKAQKELMQFQESLERQGRTKDYQNLINAAQVLGGESIIGLPRSSSGNLSAARSMGLNQLLGGGISSLFGVAPTVGRAGFAGSGTPSELERLSDVLANPGSQFHRFNQDLGDPNAVKAMERGVSYGRQGAQMGGQPQDIDAAPGGVFAPAMPHELGMPSAGVMTPRRQFYDDGGGVAPGIDTGEDKIPALLRSEELVLTPELAERLMEANPMEPQPELIGDMQELWHQPLEFSPEEGEFMAQDGGVFRPGYEDDPIVAFLRRALSTDFQPPEAGISPETHPELFGQAPFRMEARPTETPGLTPFGELPLMTPELPRVGPGEATEIPLLPEDAGPALGAIGMPGPGSISITQAGRPVDRLTSSGDAGHGKITPRPGGEGTLSVMGALPTSPEERQQEALAHAMRRRDLLNAAMTTDPVGSPEKQARLERAALLAQNEIDSIANQIEAMQTRKILEAQTEVEQAKADAMLNQSVANQLRAAAQSRTAEANYAKALQDMAANDPMVAQLLNTFEASGLSKTERGAEMAEAILSEILRARGLEIQENGWLSRIFGAPSFELAPTPEAGLMAQNPAATAPAPGSNPDESVYLDQFMNQQGF